MEITREVFEKLQQMVNRVVKSPRSDFYRAKFAKENFNPKRDLNSISDIVRVPRLTREELTATHPTKRLYSNDAKLKAIRYSSGTTGSPVLLSFRTIPRYAIPGTRPLILAFTPDLNVLYAIAPRSASPPYLPPLIGHPNNYVVTAALAEAYGIDAIVSTPTRLLLLAPELPLNLRQQIKTLLIASERFTAHLSEILRKWFPNAILDVRYGISESNNFIGYQCNRMREQRSLAYHSHADYLVEFTDIKIGSWVETVQEGEILITELYESPHQLIRYRTGDAGKIVSEEQCPCGAPFTFEVIGRINHDIIKMGGMMFRTDEIERVIKEFPEIEEDFRGVVETKRTGNDKEEIQFSLTIILKQKKGIHPYFLEQLKRNFSERFFLTPSKTLADCINEKRISSFDVFAVESFPFETKTQRLRLIER